MYRYAIYFAPPRESLLWRTGTAWLGRDPESGAAMSVPAIAGYTSDRLRQLTSAARRYGLHATLKAPFRLRPPHDRHALEEALAVFCADQGPVALPPLELAVLGGFIALRPVLRSEPLQQFAFACVERFDTFRAPATQAELARRYSAQLSPSQLSSLSRHGYPYVGADFTFHLTLTDKLKGDDRFRLLPLLAPLFAGALREEMSLAEIALFVESEPGAPFTLLRRFPLQAR